MNVRTSKFQDKMAAIKSQQPRLLCIMQLHSWSQKTRYFYDLVLCMLVSRMLSAFSFRPVKQVFWHVARLNVFYQRVCKATN